MRKLTLMSRSLLAVLIIGLSVSCSEDKDAVAPDQGAPPTLPPLASFAAYEAIQLPEREGEDNGRLAQEYDNFGHAYLNYAGWHTGLKLHLALPVVAFKSAFDSEAEYLSDEDRWVWAYESTIGGDQYSVKLYGEKIDANSVWEMRVSKEGGYQNVIWFEGIAALDGSGGGWTVYKDGDNPRTVLDIDWKASTSKEDIPFVKYKSLDTQSNLNGTYIEYGTLTGGDFTVFYNIYNAKEENTINIEYNNKTRQGRVSDLAEYEDEAWHCWNSDFEDTVCE